VLYFIIKDHPFIDGNKRIGSFIFLLYLKLQQLPLKLNENGLVALALL
jgi:DNA ligase (NAD+)